LHLIIVHHHLRPGGVRRVIERTLPHILSVAGRGPHHITLACGEASDAEWNRALSAALGGVTVELFVDPAFLYLAEQARSPGRIRTRVAKAVTRLLEKGPGDRLIWAHNPGLGRNLLLTEALGRGCMTRAIPMIAHHHDWWFENRWWRCNEIRECGFATLQQIARVLFPASGLVRHATINRADAGILRRHLHARSAWLPTPMDPAELEGKARPARRWLAETLGIDAPVWLLPCRLLRRKNIAEAILLTRWLRPGAWLVSTGGPSSTDEETYHDRLIHAARRGKWQLRLGVLANGRGSEPSVPDLLSASEAVLFTSIQEGFGLPYLEAAAAKRPLIARSLPNVAPDLERLGFRFPQLYQELLVHPDLFDAPAERERQRQLFRAWMAELPSACRAWVEVPTLLSGERVDRPVPFSRLTLTAQLEVLSRPFAESWRLCAPLNPFLRVWRRRAAAGRLQSSAWPRLANRWLRGAEYARRFHALARAQFPGPIPRGAASAAQRELLRSRLSRKYLYPLLWSVDT
jgi:glycosyltransferase involved in cell wall biosynthesis